MEKQHKDAIEEEVLKYLGENANVSNIKELNRLKDTAQFKRSQGMGDRSGKYEINRMLFNKSKGSNRPGLTKSQREVIENRYKKRVLPKPIFIDKANINMTLEDLCIEMNKAKKKK